MYFLKLNERRRLGAVNGKTSIIKLILSMIIFGSIGVFVVYIPTSRAFVALIRGALGALFLLVCSLVRGRLPDVRAIWRNLLWLFISGGLIGVNWILLFESYKYSSVAASTLIYYLSPVFVMILSAIFLRERLTFVRIVCALAAVGGMVLINGTELGSLLALGAAVLYAIVVIINKSLIKDVGATDTTMIQLASAAICVLPYVLLTENPFAYELDLSQILLLVLVGILHTGVAYLLYFSAVREMRGLSIAIISYADPIVAVVLSFIIEGSFSLPVLIGALIIISSAVISEIFGNKKSEA